MPDTADQQHEPATGVRNVGALASLADGDAALGGDFATVDLRLFATTGAGERVLDPEPASTSLKIERSKLAAIELSVQMSLRLRQAPSGVRRQAWERIAGELATRGIETDADTLHGLGFALVADEQLQAAQAATAGR
ncbi:MAG TPA: hypothetical protein VGO80_18255 [Solirubrobacteraceae bacterium]|jgi:hypothetical protein|nr:hypothetical protein [Solirubrobacteraceae bacterium]